MSDDLADRLRACPHSPYRDPGHDLYSRKVCESQECTLRLEAATRIEELEADNAELERRWRRDQAMVAEWDAKAAAKRHR